MKQKEFSRIVNALYNVLMGLNPSPNCGNEYAKALSFASVPLHAKLDHFHQSEGVEAQYLAPHHAAISYGQLKDNEAGTSRAIDKLDRLKAAAFQYRAAYDLFHTPPEEKLFSGTDLC